MAGNFLRSLPPLFQATDEQAMWRVKMQDDAQAFAQLVNRWEKPIQSLCARMTGDPHRGEDLAQEAFAKIFARRKDYQPSGRFATFLWRVALNLCHDELRRVNRRRESALDDADGQDGGDGDSEFAGSGPAPDLQLVEQERAESVRRALLSLAEHYRTVVVLRHYEGLKFREIGEVLEIPEGTVKSRMAEALSQLNQILSGVLNEKEIPCKPQIKPAPEVPVI
jgi:RNA polymerase sigma-70 factor (ECF subfamily)